jgi:putative aldouronate transport system permease protein
VVATAPYLRNRRERVGDVMIVALILIAVAVTVLPFLYMICVSVSDPVSVAKGDVWVWPRGFSLRAYNLVIHTQGFWRSYFNTIWYTVIGTAVNVTLTVLAAYPLSRPKLFGRRTVTWVILFTLFFTGGLIPTFILVGNLGMYNSRWALIFPTAVNAFLVIVARAFFQTIPDSLIEAAYLDGANDLRILWRIVLPLSRPILGVLTLFYAVWHWNDYFTPLVYLPNQNLQPLSLFITRVVVNDDQSVLNSGDIVNPYAQAAIGTQEKYSLIILTILPIVLTYPWLMKHFIKGMLIGGIKG